MGELPQSRGRTTKETYIKEKAQGAIVNQEIGDNEDCTSDQGFNILEDRKEIMILYILLLTLFFCNYLYSFELNSN